MSLELITRPFAQNGDQMTPPDTSPTGFVNYSDGYTADYEISLASGNPQAKAVERQIQNFLFGQSTEHQMAWQQKAFPPWFAAMPGGYAKHAFVIREQPGTGDWMPYRSLIDSNIDDPLTVSASWEVQLTMAQIMANIPMPSGAGNAAAEVLSVATDFNTLLGPGTWEFNADAIVTASSNSPSGALAGMLESKTWAGAATTLRVQRYLDISNQTFVRAYNGTGWTAWSKTATVLGVRNGVYNWCAATMPTANAYALAGTPAIGTRVEGLTLRFKVPTTNTGASTINDGNGAAPLIGLTLSPLVAGDLLADGVAEVRWSTTAGGGSWVLVNCDGTAAIPYATDVVAGKIELATNAEVATGTDTIRSVTPASRRADTATVASDPSFVDNSTKSASTNWIRAAMANIASAAGFTIVGVSSLGAMALPSWLGSFLIQWGTLSVPNNSSATATLPITMNTTYVLIAGWLRTTAPTSGSVNSMSGEIANNTTIRVRNSHATNTESASWLAIGRI